MRNDDGTGELYELLPAVYRLRDAEAGYPLRALLAVVAEQADLVRDNIAGLWDDLFVETCAEWVIPYIGDLVGNVPLHGAAAFGALVEAGQHPRADVAKTISYRRRKGTLPMLEELTRDVTGWGAHAVAFFELLGWAQQLNHLRMDPAPDPRRRDPAAFDRVGTAHVRNTDAMDRSHGPFDSSAHTADIRPIGRRDGWHGIGKVGLFVWRLGAYRLAGVTSRRSATHQHGWHLSPFGNPAPLFTLPAPETDQTGLAGERNVPGPIRPLAFQADPAGWYGPDASLHLVRGKDPVPAEAVVCCDLRDWRRPRPARSPSTPAAAAARSRPVRSRTRSRPPSPTGSARTSVVVRTTGDGGPGRPTADRTPSPSRTPSMSCSRSPQQSSPRSRTHSTRGPRPRNRAR